MKQPDAETTTKAIKIITNMLYFKNELPYGFNTWMDFFEYIQLPHNRGDEINVWSDSDNRIIGFEHRPKPEENRQHYRVELRLDFLKARLFDEIANFEIDDQMMYDIQSARNFPFLRTERFDKLADAAIKMRRLQMIRNQR